MNLKYTGNFNYQNETSQLETEASSVLQAWYNFCFGLAKKYGVNLTVMKQYFDGSKSNFEIKERIKV